MLKKMKEKEGERLMNRREFIKLLSAGTVWVTTITFTDIIGAKPAVNTLEKLPKIDLITETEDILDEDGQILRLGKEVFSMSFHWPFGITTEFVYKLDNDYYFRSEFNECVGGVGDDDWLFMHAGEQDPYVDVCDEYYSGDDMFIVMGPFDSIDQVCEVYEKPGSSDITSINCSEISSKELALSMPDSDSDSTMLINGEVWGYDEDEEYIRLDPN